MLLSLAGVIALNVHLYVIVPKGFFPQQDTGALMGSIQADQSISFQAMRDKLQHFVDIVKADPAVQGVVGFTGGGQLNTAQMFITLRPVAERKLSADQVIGRLRGKLAREPGASLFLQATQDIRVGGRSGNAQYQYTLQADDLETLRAWESRARQAFSRLPGLTDVSTISRTGASRPAWSSTAIVWPGWASVKVKSTPRLTICSASGWFRPSTTR